METINIRVKLHDFIDHGDEKLLQLMYSVAREYSEANDASFFSKEDIELFEERRKKRLNGESKVYSWTEAKAMITGKKYCIMLYKVELQTEAIEGNYPKSQNTFKHEVFIPLK